jgi:hypothetical protein
MLLKIPIEILHDFRTYFITKHGYLLKTVITPDRKQPVTTGSNLLQDPPRTQHFTRPYSGPAGSQEANASSKVIISTPKLHLSSFPDTS